MKKSSINHLKKLLNNEIAKSEGALHHSLTMAKNKNYPNYTIETYQENKVKHEKLLEKNYGIVEELNTHK